MSATVEVAGLAALAGFAGRALVMGVAGSAAMDLWGLVLRRRFGIATLDYAMLGRWLGHMARGRFHHARIAASPPIPAERPLGWLAHYWIGVVFAGVLLAAAGPTWSEEPSILPPLLVGFATIAAPWLVMQPGMGAGIAGSRTPNPRATRLRNVATQTVYGLGLYAAAAVLAWIAP